MLLLLYHTLVRCTRRCLQKDSQSLQLLALSVEPMNPAFQGCVTNTSKFISCYSWSRERFYDWRLPYQLLILYLDFFTGWKSVKYIIFPSISEQVELRKCPWYVKLFLQLLNTVHWTALDINLSTGKFNSISCSRANILSYRHTNCLS